MGEPNKFFRGLLIGIAISGCLWAVLVIVIATYF